MKTARDIVRGARSRRGLRPHLPLYLVTFIVVGVSLGVLGPALSQLRERTDTGIGDIGILFVAQSGGYVVGSFVAGRGYDRFDGHRVFAGALVALGAGLFLIPSLDGLAPLFGAFLLIGAGAAAAAVGANTLIMWHLRSGVGRAVNSLHMCFGLGALSAPLLVHVGLDVAMRSVALGCLVLALWAVSVPSPVEPAGARDEQTDTTPRLLLFATFFLFYAGVEVGFAGWVHTYGSEIGFGTLASTWLISTFWIGFTVGRVLSSLFAPRLDPKVVLVGAGGLAIVAASVLVIGDGRAEAVWAGTAMMGLATAPQFPVMLTYLQQQIRVTGTVTSWFVGAAGIGGVLFPWVLGRWLDAGGAVALPWMMLLLSVLTLGSFAVSNRALGG